MRVSDLPGLRDEWYAVARIEDALARPVQTIRLFGDEYILFAPSAARPALLSPYCPHRGAHLGAAVATETLLQCCYHGWQFDSDGYCRRIPQHEESLPIPLRARIRSYPVAERYGMLWACVGRPASPGPPDWPEADELGWRVQVDFFEEWRAPALRIIDNNIDQSHPAFVHQSTFGDPSCPRVPHYELESTTRGFKARIAHVVTGVGPQMGVADEETSFERVTEVELLTPVHSRILLAYDGRGHDYCFYGSATPIDDERSMYVRISALSRDDDVQPYQMFWSFGRRVTEEDRVVVETTSLDFPVELQTEVHTQADKTTVAFRRILARLAQTEQGGIARATAPQPVLADP